MQLTWLLVALLAAMISGRQARRLPGADAFLLISESLVLLGVMMLGALPGVSIAVIAVLATGYRLGKKRDFYLPAISRAALSVSIAGWLYYALINYFAEHPLPIKAGQAAVAAILMLALASSRYIINAIIAALISKASGQAAKTGFLETLPKK
ncbi:MAG TPA: hypothetical protein VFQ92_06720, partial [Blastocatellia bacterium]|nr:hypothetical protein [Blastocatellia bacterium]